MIRGKHCPNCDGDLVIWHATLYRTFKPEELTQEKIQEFKQWFEDVYLSKIDEFFGSIGQTGATPITCPHCDVRLVYTNRPVDNIQVFKGGEIE